MQHMLLASLPRHAHDDSAALTNLLQVLVFLAGIKGRSMYIHV